MSCWENTGRDEGSVPIMGTTQSVGKSGRWKVSSYAGGRGEALPWGLVLVEGIVVALLGLVLLVAPGASLVFLVWLLGIYLFIAGIFRIVGIFLDASSWGWQLAAGILCLIAGLAILSNPLWSTTLASTWLVILVGFLAMLQGAAGLIVAFQGGGWGMGALSVLGILLGLFLVINPLIGVGALTLILAIFMLIGGVGAVVQAFRMRREPATAQQPRRDASGDRPPSRDRLTTNAQTGDGPVNLGTEEPLLTPEDQTRTLQSKEPRKQQTKGIFISYRRDESAGYAGRIADSFQEHFGEDKVFRDIDSIEPGLDFAEAIERAVGSSEVLLAVIGKNWVTATDAAGHKRLESTDDYVRVEIAAALQRNIRVVPLLIQGASMPSANELPNDLAPLARRNAFELHDTSWRDDIQRLISVLERVIEP